MAVNFDDWRVQRVLEWLCTIKEDRDPSTQGGLADELGFTSDSEIKRWKNDPEFLAEWERRYRKSVASPEKMQLIAERLYETATDRSDPRQVQAAREYRAAVEAVKPPTPGDVRGNVREMSTEVLNELASRILKQEMDDRGATAP